LGNGGIALCVLKLSTTQWSTLSKHIRERRIYLQAEWLLVSERGLCPVI